MTDIVFVHEGTVAKVIGDAIQMLFNAPGDQPDYAKRAIACAQELDVWAQVFRERWKAKGENFGLTRIGVHAGPGPRLPGQWHRQQRALCRGAGLEPAALH
jgi:class 3 adenylate cyclase